MPYLRLAGCLTPIDIDKIARLFDFPYRDVAIVGKIIQRASEHPSELAQFRCLAAAFLAQIIDADREGLAMC